MGEATLNLSATALPTMNRFGLTSRPALLADIAAIMAIERSPDYDRYVARSETDEHRAMLALPSHAYRVGVGQSGSIEAFAVLRGLGDPQLNIYLKRIAVARPSQGVGTAFLGLVLDEAFGSIWRRALPSRLFCRQFPRSAILREAGFHSRRRDAQSLSAGRRDSRRPCHDGDPQE